MPHEVSAVSDAGSELARLRRRLAELEAQAMEAERSRRALRDRERRFLTLLESSSEAILVLDAKGTIVEDVPRTGSVLGYSGISHEGMPFGEFLHPEDRATMLGLFRELVAGKTPKVVAQCRARHRDGMYRWLNFVATNRLADPLIQGIVVNYHDVSDHLQALDEVRQHSELLLLLTDSLPGFVSYVDGSECYRWVNQRYEEWFGLPRDAIIGKSIREVHGPELYDGFRKHVATALAGQEVQFEQERRARDGSRHTFTTRYVPHRQPDGTNGIFVLAFDVTKERQAEADRLKLEAQLQHAQKLESLGVLAGGVAHDFNNLLTGILGNAGLALLDLPNDSPVRPTIEQIEVAGLRAAELIRQMLAYAGRGRFLVKPVCLSRVVQDMATLLQSAISRRAMLRLQLARELPPVEADAAQMQQLVLNLVTNSSDALKESSGTITVRTRLEQVDRAFLLSTYIQNGLAEGPYVCLEVVDTGCGMNESVLSRMFDPFFTTKFAGRGLGLAAVLGIVRSHRGTIRVRSEPGKGTTITVLLPALPGVAAVAPPPAPVDSRWRGTGRILVVDDQQSVRTLARGILEKAGFQITEAAGGQEALALFRQQPRDFRLVLLDLTMPEMGGEPVLQELQVIRPDVRVLLMSGYSEHEVTPAFAGKGLAGFLQKPFGPADLRAAVRRALPS